MKSKIIVRVLLILVAIYYSNKTMAQNKKADSLSFYRDQIDNIDKQLIELLGKRMQVVEQVGHYKAKNNILPLQQARFDTILKKNMEMGKQYKLSAVLVTEIMNAIHKESLSKENAIVAPGAVIK